MEDIVTVSLDRPVWGLGLEDASWLIPNKPSKNISFAVMSFSAEKKGIPEEGKEQREDDIGRTTRALPFYIAERINLETDCSAVNYNPILKGSGPVLSAKRSKGESFSSVFQEKHSFIITGHFEKDYLNLRNKLNIYLYSMESGKEILIVQLRSLFESHSDMATKAANELFIELEKSNTCIFKNHQIQFPRPPMKFSREYMDGLGQLFMQTLVQNDYFPKENLWGEDRMLNWYISLWKAMPESVVPRLMYIRGVLASFEYGSEAHKPHISQLSKYLSTLTDLKDPVNRISPVFYHKIGRLGDFNTKRQLLRKIHNKSYQLWLEKLSKEKETSNKAN